MHLQRNATQRNAYQNYILLLTNNFKFYILQILGHLNFLSVFFVLAKNQFASLNNNAAHAVCRWQAHCVNISEKSTQGGSIRLTSPQECACRWQAHCVNNSEISMQGVTIPCYSEFAFSYALKNQFASLNNNAADAHCVNISEKSAQEGSLRLTSPQSVRPLGTTPCYSDFASNFEIISRNENYAFNHNKNFCRNGNNQSLRGFSRSNLFSVDCHAYARNDKFVICDDKSKGDYFLAMIMAEILFLVFGIILISAFYLIKKLKKIYFEGEKHNEKDFSNNNGFAYYGKRKCIRYVWS